MDNISNNSIKKISFILPAKNEEKNIPETIIAIKILNLAYPYEIILIDHNSTDATSKVAEQFGARVFRKVGGTIGSARNLGAKISNAHLIVFIDADVSLTPEWNVEMDQLLPTLLANENYMTGSHCSAPDDGAWLERYWFNNFPQEDKTTHLGTGHLIVSKSFFDKIGGFDENLVTGEDYEFCIRCKQNGALLKNNVRLRVIHRDFPKNLKQFVQREVWHGAGDCRNFSALLRSKVALMALVFLGLHFLMLLIIIGSGNLIGILAVASGIMIQVVISSLLKFKNKKVIVIFVNSIVFYFYYAGRAISIIKNVKKLFSR
jgi:glycosyltransferase involved in cell wall biosynthesis